MPTTARISSADVTKSTSFLTCLAYRCVSRAMRSNMSRVKSCSNSWVGVSSDNLVLSSDLILSGAEPGRLDDVYFGMHALLPHLAADHVCFTATSSVSAGRPTCRNLHVRWTWKSTSSCPTLQRATHFRLCTCRWLCRRSSTFNCDRLFSNRFWMFLWSTFSKFTQLNKESTKV